MATPFLGELKLVSFNFAPNGWAMCNGQLLSISQNTALFSLIGTYYGGNGTSNFQLPDLRSRTPMHMSGTQPIGYQTGVENVTLTLSQLPTHGHTLAGTNDLANANVPGGAVPAAKPRGGVTMYAPTGSGNAVLNTASVAPVGGGQPHNNLQPYLSLNWVIALVGIYPSRN
jgi:microcystin-dependent protein